MGEWEAKGTGQADSAISYLNPPLIIPRSFLPDQHAGRRGKSRTNLAWWQCGRAQFQGQDCPAIYPPSQKSLCWSSSAPLWSRNWVRSLLICVGKCHGTAPPRNWGSVLSDLTWINISFTWQQCWAASLQHHLWTQVSSPARRGWPYRTPWSPSQRLAWVRQSTPVHLPATSCHEC